MNDNTILRIKVPAHLYESVKKQLTLNEAKAKPHYGAGMEVVKEKKMKAPKDGMKKVEEEKVEELDNKNDGAGDAPAGKIDKVLASPAVITALKALNVAIANKRDYADLLKKLADKLATGEGDAFVQGIESNPSFKRADQSLAAVSGEKIKEEEESIEESVDVLSDPNFWAGLGGMLLALGPIGAAVYSDYKKAKTPEDKKSVLSKARDIIGKAMGGTNEAKEEVEEAKEEDIKKNLKNTK